MGEDEKGKNGIEQELCGLEQARLNLLAAKEQFARAADSVDPLAIVKERPLLSTGGAFLLGFGLTTLSRQLALVQFIPLALQMSETVSRIFANIRKN